MGKLELTAPPEFPLKLLRWFCNPNLVEDVEGDVIELFHDRSEINKSKARVSFYVDVLLLFRPGIIKNFQILNNIINFSMVKNFLKIAFRNAIRYKGYTLLNLLGLVVGIVIIQTQQPACSLPSQVIESAVHGFTLVKQQRRRFYYAMCMPA